MPPTDTREAAGTLEMLCLSRHSECPWDAVFDETFAAPERGWTGLRYACLKIIHLYCKIFEREELIEMIIRKTCKSCGCERLQHAVYHEELGSVRDRLGLRDPARPSGAGAAHNAYDWAPPGLTAKQTEMYFASLPPERSPLGPGGAAAYRAWRARALATQLPRQDLSLAHCRHLDEKHRASYEDFVAARNEIVLDVGMACQHHGPSVECLGCHKLIRTGSIAVLAPRIGEEALYHPGCFTCATCKELLVELAHCALDGQPYCERHYADTLKPRCDSCDEVRSTHTRAHTQAHYGQGCHHSSNSDYL